MNCNDVSELIPSVLDGELRADERIAVEQHLNACPRCHKELELHSMTKRLIQQRLHRIPAPPELVNQIFTSLAGDSVPERSTPFRDLVPFRITWKPIAAFAGVLAVFVILLLLPSSKTPRSHAGFVAPIDDDIIHQTYDNYDKFLTGSMLPQISSNDSFDVQQFFTQKVDFKVNVPKMNRCKLVGGSVSHHRTAPVAHVVYKYGDQMIYLYQVKLQDVLDGNALILPGDVKEELMQNCSYIRNHQPDCTMIIRIMDSTVCCFVADVPREQMLSYIDDNH